MPPSSDDTRTRLVEAAGLMFADKGFDAAGVREICHEAKANVAAIKYYFGDKRSLYKAVLEHVHVCKENLGQVMASEEWQAQTPLQQLKSFILEMVKEHLASQKPAWHLEIMLWEMTRPTPEGKEVIELQLRPMATHLKKFSCRLWEMISLKKPSGSAASVSWGRYFFTTFIRRSPGNWRGHYL